MFLYLKDTRSIFKSIFFKKTFLCCVVNELFCLQNRLIRSLLSPDRHRTLMCVNTYDDSGEFQGPPMCVQPGQVRELFGGKPCF